MILYMKIVLYVIMVLNIQQDHIYRVIESVCNNYGLTIKMISTNYVFPRIIKASEEKALIWDQTYWELFSLYLAYFTDLNAIQKKIIVYDESSVQPKILIPYTIKNRI